LKLKLTMMVSESVPEILKTFFGTDTDNPGITSMKVTMVAITTQGADMKLSGKKREFPVQHTPKFSDTYFYNPSCYQ